VIADRTACSILTLFIVTATSWPLNKKSIWCQSANPINNYCGSASANLQSAHLSGRALQSAQPHRPWWAVALNGTVSSLIVEEPTRSVRNAITVYWESGGSSFFVVHFVAKRYILQQKCQKGRIGTLMLGSRWNNFWPSTPTPRATMHSTDRRTDNRLMPIADHTV